MGGIIAKIQNINPSENSENIEYHTYYMKLKPERAYVETYWEGHPEMDRFFEANYLLIHKEVLNSFPTAYCKFDDHNTVSI